MKLLQLLEKIDFSFDSPFNGSKVNVHKNPNYAEMNSARNKSNYHELRGLLVGHNVVYVWDANLATHDMVIELLSFEPGVDVKRFILDDENQIIPAGINNNYKDFIESPMIQRMLKS